MIDPIAYGDTLEYILPRDKTDPTIWLIGPLDSLIKAKIQSMQVDVDLSDPNNPKLTPRFNPMEQHIMIIRIGLKGFKNFKLKGRDVPFKLEKKKIMGIEREVVSDETIKYIPYSAHSKIADAIWAESTVTEKEEKN